MARAVYTTKNVELFYKIKFDTAIRGHHVYKNSWTPIMGQELFCKHDQREEATETDVNAIGIYKDIGMHENDLVGHAPIELSCLLNDFLKSSETNLLKVTVAGKRKREVGLVVPGKFCAYTKKKALARVLDQEIEKRKRKYSHFEIDHVITNIYRMFPCNV